MPLSLAFLACMGVLAFFLIYNNASTESADLRVRHTHQVIISAERLSSLVEGMVSAQRGYIISGRQVFLDEYESRKKQADGEIENIKSLTMDNPAQTERLKLIGDYSAQLTAKLEDRANRYKIAITEPEDFLNGLMSVNDFKSSILQLNEIVLNEEYALLNRRIKDLELEKIRYFRTLMISLGISAAVLFFLNGFLARSQRKRGMAEMFLQEAEHRFELAVEATQDGIFDWNVKTGQVFYSGRYFSMLGYDKGPLVGTTEDFSRLLHPEDAPQAWKNITDLIEGRISDYSQEFRMKSERGNWVWIQSRARIILGKDGKPARMVGAHADVTLIKEREEDLKHKKFVAEESNRAKSEFLAHMSHEIRTPLTAISGIAEIFEKNIGRFDEKQKTLVKTLASSSAALKDLINDILDFSKIESGELELHEEYFSLNELFESIVSIMGMRARKKNIDFTCDYEGLKESSFYGDRARLRQILINLVSNAVKFTDKGSVAVSARMEGNESPVLRIDVTDTGIGVAQEHAKLIFERFKQADPSVSRKYGGSGLGLSISKNLARLMGGDILLRSEPGRGSVFSLILPDRHGIMKASGSVSPSKRPDRSFRKKRGERKKILIAEDYDGNAVIITYLLDELGCDCDIARNGMMAIDLWRKNNYDLILMDVQMPIVDGLTATRRIRALEERKGLSRTPIVGMTAHALSEDRAKCFEAGMDSYFPKPINEAAFKREILKHIDLKSVKRQAV